MTYAERERVAKNFQGVVNVVPQNEWDYCPNIRKYSPSILFTEIIGIPVFKNTRTCLLA